jgi:hypothetical protein
MTRTKCQRTTWERVFSFMGICNAIWALTLAPLIGAIMSGRPRIEATAMQMLIAVIFMVLSIAPRAFRRPVAAIKRSWTAAALAESDAGGSAADRATAKQLARELNLPWIEDDGLVLAPGGSVPLVADAHRGRRRSAPGEGDREIHLNLHAARMARQPEITGLVNVSEVVRGKPMQHRWAPPPADPADIEVVRRYAASDLPDDIAIGLPSGRVHSVGTLRLMVARELGDPGPL